MAIKRRKLNQLSLFLLGMGAVGCSGRSAVQQGGSASIPVTSSTMPPTPAAIATPSKSLNWMGHWLGEDQRETLVREVAQEFAFQNQNINLNLKFPLELGIRSKPLTAQRIVEMIRTDTIDWDVVWMDADIYELVAQELGDRQWGQQHLVDFAGVEGFTASQKPFITTDPLYRQQTGGILVGPYLEGYYYALYYNRDVAEKVGVEIKSEGMTFEDLLAVVQAVQNYNRNQGTQIAAFYESKDWTTLEILFQNLARSEFTSFEQTLSETRSAAKIQALRKTLEAFETLGQYQPLIASHAKNLWFDTRNLVLKDEALFYINGTWMYSHWRGLDPEKMTKMVPVELPVFQPVDYYLGGYIPTWAVMKNAPNREQAIALLMFWSRPAIAEKWVRYTKNPTGIAGNLSVAETGSDVFEQFQSNLTAKYGARVHYSNSPAYLLGKTSTDVDPALNQAIRDLLSGKTTAVQALRTLNT